MHEAIAAMAQPIGAGIPLIGKPVDDVGAAAATVVGAAPGPPGASVCTGVVGVVVNVGETVLLEPKVLEPNVLTPDGVLTGRFGRGKSSEVAVVALTAACAVPNVIDVVTV